MINIWEFQEAKRIKIIDIDNQEFIGNVIEITDAEEYADENMSEDGITISADGVHIEFMQSEIKSIEVVEG